MKEKMNCPICRKRAFDICSSAKGDILVELKCPHCRNIIQVRYRICSSQKEKMKEELVTY
jgi:transposase-like protein